MTTSQRRPTWPAAFLKVVGYLPAAHGEGIEVGPSLLGEFVGPTAGVVQKAAEPDGCIVCLFDFCGTGLGDGTE